MYLLLSAFISIHLKKSYNFLCFVHCFCIPFMNVKNNSPDILKGVSVEMFGTIFIPPIILGLLSFGEIEFKSDWIDRIVQARQKPKWFAAVLQQLPL